MRKPDLRKYFYDDPRKNALYLGIEALVMLAYLALDLLTKEFIYGPIAAGEPDIILIDGVLRFTAVENTGASFGIFKDATLALSIVSLITVVAVTAFLFFAVPYRRKLLDAALILIIAGGIGNLVDRFALHYVRDFIYFELIDFAVFNVADSCLTIGCILLIIFVLFCYRPASHKKSDSDGRSGGGDRSV